MTNLFLRVSEYLDKKRPFVIYSKPESNKIIGIFQGDNTLHFTENFREEGFIFAPFSGDKYVLIPKDNSEIIIEDVESFQFNISGYPYNIDYSSQQSFEILVQKGIDEINKGKIEKVVLSRTQYINTDDFDAIISFKKLITIYPAAFKYYFYHPEVGEWMGATPEQLAKIEGDILNTVALAGTQVFTNNIDIVWGEKEKKEQQFVTDFIIESLQKYGNTEFVSNPYTFRAGNVLHIKTDISVKLNQNTELKQIVEKLHPTPAVCGLPKNEAKEFIIKEEGYNREYYSGFLGELNIDFESNKQEKSDLFVNLRCMKIYSNTAQLYIGCGITKDSNPENEFIETVNKSITLKRILF